MTYEKTQSGGKDTAMRDIYVRETGAITSRG